MTSDGVHLHVSTCTSFLNIFGMDEWIVLIFGLRLGIQFLGTLERQNVGCICKCARANPLSLSSLARSSPNKGVGTGGPGGHGPYFSANIFAKITIFPFKGKTKDGKRFTYPRGVQKYKYNFHGGWFYHKVSSKFHWLLHFSWRSYVYVAEQCVLFIKY